MANPEYIEAAKKCVRDAPYPSLIGLDMTELDFDYCRFDLTLAEKHMQPFGIVHGGVIATLIDSATFWAAYLRLPEEAGLVNVDLKLNYLKAVTGGVVSVHSECLRAGRQISYAEARVIDADGNLIAHGASTLMAVPGRGLQLDVPKFLAP